MLKAVKYCAILVVSRGKRETAGMARIIRNSILIQEDSGVYEFRLHSGLTIIKNNKESAYDLLKTHCHRNHLHQYMFIDGKEFSGKSHYHLYNNLDVKNKIIVINNSDSLEKYHLSHYIEFDYYNQYIFIRAEV